VSRFNPAAVAIMPFYPAANNRDPAVAAWQNNLAYTEHFNKDVFWNWVGKVDHTSPATTASSAVGQERAQRDSHTTAIRSGPAQNGQLPLIPHEQCGGRRLGAMCLAGAPCSTSAGGYSNFLELSRSDEGLGFDLTSLGPARQPGVTAPGQLFPQIEMVDYVQLSRGGIKNTSKIWVAANRTSR